VIPVTLVVRHVIIVIPVMLLAMPIVIQPVFLAMHVIRIVTQFVITVIHVIPVMPVVIMIVM
jgi:hypothetical protein